MTNGLEIRMVVGRVLVAALQAFLLQSKQPRLFVLVLKRVKIGAGDSLAVH